MACQNEYILLPTEIETLKRW